MKALKIDKLPSEPLEIKKIEGSFRQELQGIGVALVTPFDEQENIDFNALEKLIEFLLQHDVQYLVTLGTTGETPTLSREEKIDLVKFTFEKVNKRIPVVVGIGGNDTRSVVKDLETYPIDDALAILSVSPYYSRPSQEGIYQHFAKVAQATYKPIILYNVPARTGRNMLATTTVRLANDFMNVVAIKEASGDLVQCMEIVRDRPNGFAVLSGDDALAMAQFSIGMEGVISVAANAFPKEFAAMLRHTHWGEKLQARLINERLMHAYDLMFEEGNPTGIKEFLHQKGIIKPYTRLPVIPASEHLRHKIKRYLIDSKYVI